MPFFHRSNLDPYRPYGTFPEAVQNYKTLKTFRNWRPQRGYIFHDRIMSKLRINSRCFTELCEWPTEKRLRGRLQFNSIWNNCLANFFQHVTSSSLSHVYYLGGRFIWKLVQKCSAVISKSFQWHNILNSFKKVSLGLQGSRLILKNQGGGNVMCVCLYQKSVCQFKVPKVCIL